jgi:hypothetical protein
MSHSPRMDVDQSENGMHGKISTTVPNRPKSQIKDAMHNSLSC